MIHNPNRINTQPCYRLRHVCANTQQFVLTRHTDGTKPSGRKAPHCPNAEETLYTRTAREKGAGHETSRVSIAVVANDKVSNHCEKVSATPVSQFKAPSGISKAKRCVISFLSFPKCDNNDIRDASILHGLLARLMPRA